jgi:glycosyltransferase involved in cell wall biosynthesis
MRQLRPLVSAIIPTYNRMEAVRRAIESVLAQTYAEIEIIVVDDGSMDETRDVAASYGHSIKYLYQRNQGPAVARNTGILAVKGQLLAFLDSDDLWAPDKVERQVDVFMKNPSCFICATGHKVVDGDGNVINTTVLGSYELALIKKGELYKNFFATPTVMMRVECFLDVGFFDPHLHFAEDWDMWLRVMEKYYLQYLDEALTTIVVHQESITRTAPIENMNDWKRVIQRHACHAGYLLNRKRWSWYYLNCSIWWGGISKKKEIEMMLRSIVAWPFWMPGRIRRLWRGLISA